MKRDEVLKKLRKIRDQYNNIQDKDSLQFERFDDAKDMAKCHDCEMFIPLNREFDKDHFAKCRKDRHCGIVAKEYSKLFKIRMEMREIEKEYSKNVFALLCKEDPALINRKSNKRVSWASAFGEKYELLSDDKKYSLIALIEEDGGEYRVLWDE